MVFSTHAFSRQSLDGGRIDRLWDEGLQCVECIYAQLRWWQNRQTLDGGLQCVECMYAQIIVCLSLWIFPPFITLYLCDGHGLLCYIDLTHHLDVQIVANHNHLNVIGGLQKPYRLRSQYLGQIYDLRLFRCQRMLHKLNQGALSSLVYQIYPRTTWEYDKST